MAYTLTHPDSKQEIKVDAGQVAMYVSQGWQTKATVKPPKLPATSKPSSPPRARRSVSGNSAAPSRTLERGSNDPRL